MIHLNVTTYNVENAQPSWNKYVAVKKGLSTDERKKQILENINHLTSTSYIVCMQEIHASWVAEIQEKFKDRYTFTYFKHNDLNREDGVGILSLKTLPIIQVSPSLSFKYKRMDGKNKGKEAELNHGYIDIDLNSENCNPSKKKLSARVGVCHLAGGGNGRGFGEGDQGTQIDQVIKDFSQNASEIDVLLSTGDLNADDDDKRIFTLLENGFRPDISIQHSEPAKSRRIDWIFTKSLKNEVVIQSIPMVERFVGIQLDVPHPKASDHLPSSVYVAIKKFPIPSTTNNNQRPSNPQEQPAVIIDNQPPVVKSTNAPNEHAGVKPAETPKEEPAENPTENLKVKPVNGQPAPSSNEKTETPKSSWMLAWSSFQNFVSKLFITIGKVFKGLSDWIVKKSIENHKKN